MNLPEKARKSLEFAIYIFRYFYLYEDAARRTPPKKRRAKLKRAAKAGRDFITAVSSLGFPETETLRNALPTDDWKDEEWAEQEVVAAKLNEARSQIRLIVDWCDEATRLVGRGQRRRDKGLLRDFVLKLDRILLEHTGKQIKRSSKPQQPIVQFVRAACKVFDPRVGNGSIDEAMKAAIAKRGKVRE